MIFDYYASLAEKKACPERVNECGLVSGFVDVCTVWFCQDKPLGRKELDPRNNARQCYMKRAVELVDLKLPQQLQLETDHVRLPDSTWFGIDVSFTLKSSWYSKDDRPFHVLDTPVRKDRVFGVPFMSATSWKGLLRWACRMQAGLTEHLDSHGAKVDVWNDPSWIVHLFGNEKGEQKDFRSGALIFYPTWFNKVSFEVINPHSRTYRAGTQPIYYEVVPVGTKGRLRLLYAPVPGEVKRDNVKPSEVLSELVDAIEELVQKYGISAKRTAGWGTAKICEWKAFPENGKPVKTGKEFKELIKRWFVPSGGGR